MASAPDLAESPEFKKRVLHMQIIVGALIMGVAIFMATAIVIGQTRPPPTAAGGAPPIFLYVGAGMIAMIFIARAVVLKAMIGNALRGIARGTWQPLQGRIPLPPDEAAFLAQNGDAGKLLQLFRMKSIVGAALYETPAFFLIIAYIVERRVESLVLALVPLAALALQIPTATGVSHWVGEQLQAIEQMRRDGA